MSDQTETLVSKLDDIIAQMPEDMPEELAAQKTHPYTLDGWPEKWTKLNTPPTGQPWLLAYEKARRVVEDGGIVVLHGTRGGGKTRMAYELTKQCIYPQDRRCAVVSGFTMPKRRTSAYSTAMGFFLDVRATYGKKSQRSERDAVEDMTTPGLLVLDEIQERSESPWENRLLTHVLDSRYASLRPTILIANLTAGELKESLGPSIMDRIRETGGSIEFNWPSYRNK